MAAELDWDAVTLEMVLASHEEAEWAEALE